MKKFILFLGISALTFSSCGDKQEDLSKLTAVGGAVYGGEIRMMSQEKISNLFPASITDIYSTRVSSQIFETTLALDPSGVKVIPSIAESCVSSSDAKTYTLKIRSGIKFHDNDCFGGEGRELTAADVKYALDFSCSGLKINKMSWFLTDKIVGGQAFKKASSSSLPAGGVKGITVVDDQTLKIELSNAFAGFDKLLTHPSLAIFPKEAYEKYGNKITENPVGTGAFVLDSWEKDKITLKRNSTYWKKDELGNQLPFLAGIVITYSTDKRGELKAFRNKEIDIVTEIPVEETEHILGTLKEAQDGKNVKHKVENHMSMSLNYFGFSHSSEVFKDVRVRKAFNLAIDRKGLVDVAMMGEGYAIENGFVPPMEGYPSSSVRGHIFDPAQAKALLAAAGFPNGVGFPVMKLYMNGKVGSSKYKMSEGVAKYLFDNLGVKIEVVLLSLEDKEKKIDSGEAIFWRSGWVADYADPENFLSLFYGTNGVNGISNQFKYNNLVYDRLFEAAMKEADASKRMKLFAQCDQMIIDEAVVIPLITDDFIVMYNSKVKKLETSCLERIDFSTIFIKEIRE
jgi:oligopeptide transport system substrate-binding protein